MDIDPVIERLRALAYFKTVAGATNLADALAGAAMQYPAACVVVTTDRAEANRLSGRHRQRINSRLPVVVGIKAAAASQARQRDETEAACRAVIECLAGWRPPAAASALDYLARDVRAIEDGVVWVEVAFTCQWYLTVDDPSAPAAI